MIVVRAAAAFRSSLWAMSRPFRLRCRTRRRLFWLVALMLLWQQVALAAYACPLPGAVVQHDAAALVMTSPDCMDDMQGQPDQPLCTKHCAPDSPVQSDARAPGVPASVLAALVPSLPLVDMSTHPGAFFASADASLADASPPRLLFCSLLI